MLHLLLQQPDIDIYHKSDQGYMAIQYAANAQYYHFLPIIEKYEQQQEQQRKPISTTIGIATDT